jgi:uncharacterized membrane protein
MDTTTIYRHRRTPAAGFALNFRSARDFVGWPVAIFYLSILAASLPMWPFGWHLTLHVAGAVMLIGNAIAMAVWLSVAGFAGSDASKRRAARLVNHGDVWFTVPGVVLLLLNGLAMVAARYGGPAAFTSTAWIAAGLVLVSLTGIIWALRLVPAQLGLYRLATANGDLDVVAFRSLLVRWSVWGSVATALPLLAAFVMITKPTL